MEFEYFQGPDTDMANLHGLDRCTLCGQSGTTFILDYAICPSLPDEGRRGALGCVECLQRGAFEFWHDTELGLLDEDGLTKHYRHHRPPPSGFNASALTALKRTPQIATWQQELWLTHCDDFMSYQGTWSPEDFRSHASDGNGKALFLQMTDPDLAHLWDESTVDGQQLQSWHATYYVFRCRHCGTLRGNWDCD